MRRPCVGSDSRKLINTKQLLRQSSKFEYGGVLEDTRGLLIFLRIMTLWLYKK